MSCEILASLGSVDAATWSGLSHRGDPFCSRAFLLALEEAAGTQHASHPALRWHGAHLLLKDATGAVAGLLPRYLRAHSFGDFSRDWGWEEAWSQAGKAYYPKLVSGIPYTPSPGPRLLVRSDPERPRWLATLAQTACAQVPALGAASWQCLFVEDDERAALGEAGCLLRRGVQFHWHNAGYRDFTDFLSGFTADKRKKLKRERRAVAESGLRLETRHGDDASPALWREIHAQYADTFARHGNHPALPLEFFLALRHTMPRQIVLFLAFAEPGDRLVASAICYRDADTLYGRHWGCTQQISGLHFELCYYQGIDYCLAQGLARFEPGAQGEHKLARGFAPTDTWSAYWIAEPALRTAVADFLRREDAAMQDYARATAEHLPFKAA